MRTFSQIKVGQFFTFGQKVYLKHHPRLIRARFSNASYQMNLVADSPPVADAELFKGFEGEEVVTLFVIMESFRLN